MKVELLTGPNCPGCSAMKNKLISLGVSYTSTDVSKKSHPLARWGIPLLLVNGSPVISKITNRVLAGNIDIKILKKIFFIQKKVDK